MATKAQRAEAYRRNDLIKAGPTPLEVLLHNMRQALEQGDNQTAGRWAIAAAPYCHPRMAAVKVQERRPDPVVLPTPMTPEDWIAAVGADVIALAADYSGYAWENRTQRNQTVTGGEEIPVTPPIISDGFSGSISAPAVRIFQDTTTPTVIVTAGRGEPSPGRIRSAEKIAERVANQDWTCAHCGNALPARKKPTAEYCSPGCQDRARQVRRTLRRKAQSEGR